VRRVLSLLGTAALRSRLGIALVLAIVIFGIVGVAHLFLDPDDASTVAVTPVETSASAASTEPDDGVIEPESTTTTAVDPGPSLKAGAARPQKVAEAFATAWLDRKAPAEAWYSALRPHITTQLAEKLKDVDPVVVPAERLTGAATVAPQGSGFVEVSYPVDSGTLLLRLIVVDGRWLVDGVDWERA
jgi:hypothetical protein